MVEAFADHRYIALETTRRDGRTVVTPVWFVQDAQQIYFSAPSHTGKVKRLRHTPHARIAPCDERGRLLGDWHVVRATMISGPPAEAIDRQLAARYGWQRKLLDLFGWIRGWRYTLYALALGH